MSIDKKDKKVVVFGIDGVPASLLRDFVKKGIMPKFASLLKEGTLLDMDASIPEVSSTSWSTFMTGVNPGRHNIYGFMGLKPNSYKLYFPNSSDIKSDTMWDILGREGKRSIVINIPSTYPARPLNGILTAGFVALDLKKATYPESAYRYLKSIDYRMDVEPQKASQSLALLAEDIEKTYEKRRQAILHFFDTESWDLFIGAVTETDRLHHFLWNALEDEGHGLHGFFIDFYRKIDGLIGELADRCGRDIPFLIVSDHGFSGINEEIYLNSWLREKDYLKFSKEPPGSLEDMRPETTAFALDPSRIYINLRNRYPSGSVNVKDYEGLRLKIKDDLLGLSVNGQMAVKKVFMKEDLYKGPCFDSAPDMVLLSHRGFDLKGAINKNAIYGRSIFTGAHTRDNATFFINRPIAIEGDEGINIVDVAPTILRLFGVKHDSLDGRPLVGNSAI